MGLLLFGLINYNIGFMKMASSVFCTVGLSVICTFLPMIIMVMAATVLILVHFYALSLPIALVSAVYFPPDVYFLFQVHTEKGMAGPDRGPGVRAEDPLCDPGRFRAYGDSGLDRAGGVRRDILLYGRFCKRIRGSIKECGRGRYCGKPYLALQSRCSGIKKCGL